MKHYCSMFNEIMVEPQTSTLQEFYSTTIRIRESYCYVAFREVLQFELCKVSFGSTRQASVSREIKAKGLGSCNLILKNLN